MRVVIVCAVSLLLRALLLLFVEFALVLLVFCYTRLRAMWVSDTDVRKIDNGATRNANDCGVTAGRVSTHAQAVTYGKEGAVRTVWALYEVPGKWTMQSRHVKVAP